MDSRNVAALGAGQQPTTVTAGAGVSVPTTGAPSRYPWQLVGLLWMVAFLNNADRAVIVAVMPQLRTQFQLGATQLALISSVFFWIYAIAAFLSGRLGDSGRRSRIVIAGLAFWSVPRASHRYPPALSCSLPCAAWSHSVSQPTILRRQH